MSELIVPQTKTCFKCKATKPLSEFYPVPKSKYFTSRCKECMKADSRAQAKTDRKVSKVKSEMDVIALLKSMGIPALPGKALSHKWADIIVWSCLLLEVKSSQSHDGKFTFAFTANQRAGHLRGDLIVLVCQYDTENTYHLFPANHPIFYRADGSIKTAVSYTPNRSRSGRPPVVTDELMAQHKDAWWMIEERRLKIIEDLKRGIEPPLLKAA